MIRFAWMFLVLALSVLSAETFTLDIYQPVYLGGKELKAGQYSLDLQGDKLEIGAIHLKGRTTKLVVR